MGFSGDSNTTGKHQNLPMKLTPLVEQTLSSPTASNWLKDSLKTALNRDCVDALRDAEILVTLLEQVVARAFADAAPAVDHRLRPSQLGGE